MKPLLAAVSVVALALPGSASAAAGEDKACSISGNVSLTPGLGAEGSRGTFTLGPGELGTIDCGYGYSGTFATDGRFGTKDPDSCARGGEGWGVQSFTINGQNTKNPFTFEYGSLSRSGGIATGTFEGDRFSGTFEVSPTEGDCFTKPMTKAKLTGKGTLRT